MGKWRLREASKGPKWLSVWKADCIRLLGPWFSSCCSELGRLHPVLRPHQEGFGLFTYTSWVALVPPGSLHTFPRKNQLMCVYVGLGVRDRVPPTSTKGQSSRSQNDPGQWELKIPTLCDQHFSWKRNMQQALPIISHLGRLLLTLSPLCTQSYWYHR